MVKGVANKYWVVAARLIILDTLDYINLGVKEYIVMEIRRRTGLW